MESEGKFREGTASIWLMLRELIVLVHYVVDRYKVDHRYRQTCFEAVAMFMIGVFGTPIIIMCIDSFTEWLDGE